MNQQCEACPNISDQCALVGTILMCPSCQATHGVINGKQPCAGCGFKLEPRLLKDFGGKMLCGSCLKKEYAKATDDAIARAKEHDKSIKDNSGFFNARTTPIAEIKEVIELGSEQPQFDLHAFVRERFEHFSKALFTKSDELSSAQQNQQLVISFRAEVRNNIKASDIQYNPPEKAPKVKAPRLAKRGEPKDPIQKMMHRMAEKYIGAELKRGNVVTMEQALAKINSDFA